MVIDGDPASLHARERLDHGPLQRLIDGCLALGGKTGRERTPQAQRHIGVLGGVFGRAVERDAGETPEVATRAGDFAEGDVLVAQML